MTDGRGTVRWSRGWPWTVRTDRRRRGRRIVLLLASAAAAVSAGVLVAAAMEDPPNQPTPSTAVSVADLEEELASLDEEIEDLAEPVEEFELFDQCMYLLGVTEYGNVSAREGYVFGPGGRQRARALAVDIRGFDRPEYQFLAFPGEEPPSIECNEDAGGLFTN